ncbi:hypothetical protein ACIQGZ_02025 [Streptomyces sp. NPDC092296]|uniref:hypothetical protein n=1 Tax=Streptomyces sp. NPDC092296 TaxID=3366012 RepID=UPI00380ECFBF
MTVLKRPDAVPYIATWSDEQCAGQVVVEDRRSGGIAYLDERPGDRDEWGVLWRRVESRPGGGRPEFAQVHARRQRYVMRHLRCQVCGRPADVNEQGVLWLLKDDRGAWPRRPERMAATHPPVCLPCARVAAELCPHLSGRHIAVRVRRPEVVGVYGALYAPGGGRGRPQPVGERSSRTPIRRCGGWSRRSW